MTEILIPKFDSWHANDAYGMEEQLRKTIDCIIKAKRNLKEYWILVEAHPHPMIPGAIKNTVIILPTKPSPMLGTICYHQDNATDVLTRLWVLPRDIPVPEQFLGDMVDNPDGNLSAWNVTDDQERYGMPILLS